MKIAADIIDPVQRFAAKPWLDISAADLACADHVPTMLAREEAQLYYWLTRDYLQGRGAVADLGAFVGGSTARLAAGALAAGRSDPLIHAYDRFTADQNVKDRILYAGGVEPFDGRDIFLLSHRLLTPFKPLVTLHPGEFLEQSWTGDKIEVLVVDIAKTAATADHVAAEFFPHLIAGHSIVVHQDFLHRVQPWLPAQMALLRHYFTPVARVARHCVAFLCTAVPPPEVLAMTRTAPLDDAQLARLVRMAAGRYQRLANRYWFASMVRTINDNPDIRAAWRMKQRAALPAQPPA